MNNANDFLITAKVLLFWHYKIVHEGNDKALMQHGTRLRSAWPQVGVVSSLLTSSDSVKFGLMLGSWTAPPTGATSMASRTSWLSLAIDFRCSGDWCWVVYNRSLLMSSLTLLPQSASLPQPPWPPVPKIKIDRKSLIFQTVYFDENFSKIPARST